MPLREAVSALMRGVAATAVMPRFRALAADEIVEKSPGELVTAADREAEHRLHDGLAALGFGARIVGEEAVADDPGLLDDVGTGLVWLIDPLDGTANFAAGRGPFGMMIALVEDGVPLAGWLLDPSSGRMCHAGRGEGATCDGIAVRARSTGRMPPVAGLGTHFLPAHVRDRVHAHVADVLDVRPVPRCAAESYARLALGIEDIALFQRILPWDHAAGMLFLAEAGGVATHWNRTPYRVGGAGIGMLAAADPGLWTLAADLLLGDACGLAQLEEPVR